MLWEVHRQCVHRLAVDMFQRDLTCHTSSCSLVAGNIVKPEFGQLQCSNTYEVHLQCWHHKADRQLIDIQSFVAVQKSARKQLLTAARRCGAHPAESCMSRQFPTGC